MEKIGMNSHIPDNEVLELTKNANLKWIRCDFNWIDMEPEKGSFNFNETDRVVEYCKSNSIQIFPTLGYTPPWANDSSHKQEPAKDINDWKNFVKSVVSRYKDSIKTWGMWNEPNLEEFFIGSIDDYINKVLIPGNEAAKEADPNCQTVSPEIATLDSGEWWIWVDELAKVQEHYDVFTLHRYDGNGAQSLIKDLEKGSWLAIFKIFSKYFEKYEAIVKKISIIEKPKWLSETGWASNEVGIEKQAEYYREMCNYIKEKDSFQKIFFYQIIDEENLETKWGVLNVDYSEKPAYIVLYEECG